MFAMSKTQLARSRAEIDKRCFELYGIDGADRIAWSSALRLMLERGRRGSRADDADAEDEDEEEAESALTPLAGALISWAVGVAFGRFDVRLATGERESPPEPDPFDPLPPCSPGMLTGEDGLPLEAPPPGYPIAFPRDGILADDPGDRADITGRVRAVFDLRLRCRRRSLLGRGRPDPRQRRTAISAPWLSRSLFDDTIRRYSKSRRKAPIYWQLATPSASYSRLALLPPPDQRHVLYRALRPRRPEAAARGAAAPSALAEAGIARTPPSAGRSPSRKRSSRSCARSARRSPASHLCGTRTTTTG